MVELNQSVGELQTDEDVIQAFESGQTFFDMVAPPQAMRPSTSSSRMSALTKASRPAATLRLTCEYSWLRH
ncbi:MAG: hypothetical protein IKF78_09040 [Atopobiaceae bacterium]|nr:hypothetical protein [Atopobiaceae bacterium]